MASQFFPYRHDPRFIALLLPARVRPGRDGVTIDDTTFRATFGILKLETPRTNVRGGHVIGPFHWWKAIGPRLSFVDDGLTFGTSTERGVCVHFHEPVRRVIGRKDHSALTVSVADCDGLVDAIGAD